MRIYCLTGKTNNKVHAIFNFISYEYSRFLSIAQYLLSMLLRFNPLTTLKLFRVCETIVSCQITLLPANDSEKSRDGVMEENIF